MNDGGVYNSKKMYLCVSAGFFILLGHSCDTSDTHVWQFLSRKIATIFIPPFSFAKNGL